MAWITSEAQGDLLHAVYSMFRNNNHKINKDKKW